MTFRKCSVNVQDEIHVPGEIFFKIRLCRWDFFFKLINIPALLFGTLEYTNEKIRINSAKKTVGATDGSFA